MAVQKALLITKDNALPVLNQYDMGGWEPEDLVGLYLVAPFGTTSDWNLLSKTALEKTYDKTGNDLGNGYFEVTRKA